MLASDLFESQTIVTARSSLFLSETPGLKMSVTVRCPNPGCKGLVVVAAAAAERARCPDCGQAVPVLTSSCVGNDIPSQPRSNEPSSVPESSPEVDVSPAPPATYPTG